VQIKESGKLPEAGNLKMTVVCFLVREKADLYQKGDDEKTPISLITNQELSEIVKSFCKEYVLALFCNTI